MIFYELIQYNIAIYNRSYERYGVPFQFRNYFLLSNIYIYIHSLIKSDWTQDDFYEAKEKSRDQGGSR